MGERNEIHCERCDDTGEVAYRIATGTVIGPGPVPDDAKGIAGMACDCPLGLKRIRMDIAWRQKETAK